MTTKRSLYKRFFVDPALATLTFLVFCIFRIMRIWIASAVGGALARQIGPHLSIHKHALNNIKNAFPDIDQAEIKSIALGMWENLGRSAAEYPHLDKINVYDPAGYVEVIGAQHVDLLRDDEEPGIFFSCHLANWEILSLGATQRGLEIDQVYRAPNNRMVEWLLERRRTNSNSKLIPKGSEGARKLLKSIKSGRHIGMLIDQRMNDGIPVPFFGRDAMTAPALAELALRYGCPVVPVRVKRIKGPRLRLIIEPPLEFMPTGNHHADVKAIMTLANERLESWIRDTPEQWLWLHNRWPE